MLRMYHCICTLCIDQTACTKRDIKCRSQRQGIINKFVLYPKHPLKSIIGYILEEHLFEKVTMGVVMYVPAYVTSTTFSIAKTIITVGRK